MSGENKNKKQKVEIAKEDYVPQSILVTGGAGTPAEEPIGG